MLRPYASSSRLAKLNPFLGQMKSPHYILFIRATGVILLLFSGTVLFLLSKFQR
jgi:hypothetical protein